MRYLNLCPELFGHVGKRLTKKANVNFKTNYTTTYVTITIRIFCNISRSKANQTMKFGQLIEYNVRNILSKTHAENETGGLVPDPFLFFENVLYVIKASSLHQFRYISIALNWTYIKSKLYKTDPEICSVLIFLERVLD